MIRKKIDIHIFVRALAILLLISGCINDKEPAEASGYEEGIPTEVKFTLSSRFNASPTRADGEPEDPEFDNEKIRNWFMVFIDQKGNVAKILNRSDAETGISVAETDAFEQETFRSILPSGTYSVFAFANMTAADLKTNSGIEFGVGDVLSNDDIAEIKQAISGCALNGLDITAAAIPMTGYVGEIKVKNTIEETFSIEVVRMAAKVRLLFSNSTDKDMTVTGVSFDPVTTSSVSLFPNGNLGIDYSHLGNRAYTPIANATYDELTLQCSVTVESKANEIPYTFYMKESLSDSKNEKSFKLGLKIRHGDGTSETQQYNITKDIKEYINRNDWIEIPITLSQYDVSVEALFYPPIGGYPAVLSTTHPDGSQIFIFGTEGDFSIVPHVIDKFTGTHLAPAKYSIQLGEIEDDEGIFAKTPRITTTATSLPDEITGMLSSKTGIAKVKVTVTIGTQSYIRNIYIIRR